MTASAQGPEPSTTGQPERSLYDERTALVVVDMQNDFADPAGSLFVNGGDQIIPRINDQVDAARSAGALVVYTQDWHPPVTPHFVDHGGVWPVHCVAGSWGAEFHPDLVVEGPRIRKGTGGEDGYSGFTMRRIDSGEEQRTGLHALLQQCGVTGVVVVGLAQDVCVKATALDSVTLGYETSVLVEATRPVELEPGDGRRAVDELRQAGVLIV